MPDNDEIDLSTLADFPSSSSTTTEPEIATDESAAEQIDEIANADSTADAIADTLSEDEQKDGDGDGESPFHAAKANPFADDTFDIPLEVKVEETIEPELELETDFEIESESQSETQDESHQETTLQLEPPIALPPPPIEVKSTDTDDSQVSPAGPPPIVAPAPTPNAPSAYEPGPPLDRPLKQIVLDAASNLGDVVDQVEALKHEFSDAKKDLLETSKQQTDHLREQVSKQLDDAKAAIDLDVEAHQQQSARNQEAFDAKQTEASEALTADLQAIRSEFAGMKTQIADAAIELRTMVEDKLENIQTRLDAMDGSLDSHDSSIDKLRKETNKLASQQRGLTLATRISIVGLLIVGAGVLVAIFSN